jgi:hypothetical protein
MRAGRQFIAGTIPAQGDPPRTGRDEDYRCEPEMRPSESIWVRVALRVLIKAALRWPWVIEMAKLQSLDAFQVSRDAELVAP